MANKQSEVEIEEETTVVRILSAVFITLMILIISAYSDIPEVKTADHDNITNNHVYKQALSANRPAIIKTRISTEM